MTATTQVPNRDTALGIFMLFQRTYLLAGSREIYIRAKETENVKRQLVETENALNLASVGRDRLSSSR